MGQTVRDDTDLPALVQRVRSGSAEALGVLYQHHAPAVFATAYRLLGSRTDAEDVVHDVFLGLPRALAGYQGTGPLGAWIRKVAVRAALMHLRSESRRRRASLEDAAAPRSTGWQHGVDRIALDEALGELPAPLRIVFLLKVVEGYTHDEIGELLDITTEASRARLARARAQLRQRLR